MMNQTNKMTKMPKCDACSATIRGNELVYICLEDHYQDTRNYTYGCLCEECARKLQKELNRIGEKYFKRELYKIKFNVMIKS